MESRNHTTRGDNQIQGPATSLNAVIAQSFQDWGVEADGGVEDIDVYEKSVSKQKLPSGFEDSRPLKHDT